ncbi:MAG: tetratricopeptide repeat protein [Phycisphaeraceae bacterium]|nr:MAG: tetratricopeptide repeat protein [Phycisphaeraceae bacterium]
MPRLLRQRSAGFQPHPLLSAWWAVLAASCAMLFNPGAFAAADLHPGDEAPAVTVNALDGQALEVPNRNGTVQVLLFGDASHEKVQQTVTRLAPVLGDPLLEEIEKQWVLVLTRGSDPDALLSLLDENTRSRVVVVRDSDRRVFEAYHVFAVPTIVVIDGQGKIVRVHPGPNPRIERMILEDILVGAHRIEPGGIDKDGQPEAGAGDAAQHTARLTRMASQLLQRGLYGPAERALTQVLADAPDSVDANITMGELLLATGRPAEATERFRAALRVQPESAGATLGLATAEIRQAEPDLDAIAAGMSKFLAAHPDDPRAHYLMGLIHERRGQSDEAIASFKRSAALQLGPVYAEPSVSVDAP